MFHRNKSAQFADTISNMGWLDQNIHHLDRASPQTSPAAILCLFQRNKWAVILWPLAAAFLLLHQWVACRLDWRLEGHENGLNWYNMGLNLPKKLFRKLIYKTPVCRCWPGWSRVQGLVTRRGVCIMWWPVAAAPVVRGSAADLLTSIFSSNYFSAHSKQGVSCTHHRQQVLSDHTF